MASSSNISNKQVAPRDVRTDKPDLAIVGQQGHKVRGLAKPVSKPVLADNGEPAQAKSNPPPKKTVTTASMTTAMARSTKAVQAARKGKPDPVTAALPRPTT
jgi:hypothetical protein